MEGAARVFSRHAYLVVGIEPLLYYRVWILIEMCLRGKDRPLLTPPCGVGYLTLDAKAPLLTFVCLRIHCPWSTRQCPNHNLLTLPALLLHATCLIGRNHKTESAPTTLVVLRANDRPRTSGTFFWLPPPVFCTTFADVLMQIRYVNVFCTEFVECVMLWDMWNVFCTESTNGFAVKFADPNLLGHTTVSYKWCL